MRKKNDVLKRFHDLKLRRLAERKKTYLSRTYRNCEHNELQKVNGEGKIGFCQNPEVLQKVKREVLACNQKESAKKCPFYSCQNNTQTVEKEFEEILKNPAHCGHDYPKLAMLIWFLQEEPERRKQRFLRGLVGIFSSIWSFVSFKWW